MAEASSRSRSAASRPLSPHLQIHSRPINMVMSILHRATGAALYFGTLLLAAWLIAAAYGPATFGAVADLLATLPGRIVLVGYTWALIHHALGGVRHLIWDTGRALSVRGSDMLLWLTFFGSLALTAVVWAYGLKLGGRI